MDDVNEVTVFNHVNTSSVTSPSLNLGNFDSWGSTWPNSTYFWTSYPTTIYMYQVKCPKRSCKKMNWLKLDTITPCVGCGAKLKAVSEQAEFEIEIN